MAAAVPFTLKLRATPHDLEDALDGIEWYSTTTNIGKDTLSRLLIITEELFTNTIKYGYRHTCSEPIFLTLQVDSRAGENTAILIYEDAAPPFNPLNWDITSSLSTPPHYQPVGQTGIALVLGLVHTATYERGDNINRITLTIHETC